MTEFNSIALVKDTVPVDAGAPPPDAAPMPDASRGDASRAGDGGARDGQATGGDGGQVGGATGGCSCRIGIDSASAAASARGAALGALVFGSFVAAAFLVTLRRKRVR
jgi:hypothetical protein